MQDSLVPGVTLVATQSHVAQHTDPITVSRGDIVAVEHEDTEFPGWWWCVAADGRAGWVPAELLRPATDPGRWAQLATDYTARELTVEPGAECVVLDARAGWVFVRAASDATGWVPASHVAARAPAT